MFHLWSLFKRDLPVTEDTTTEIWIGQRMFPLECDPALYVESLKTIKEYITNWITQEIDISGAMGQNAWSGILNTFRVTDIRVIAWPSTLATFKTALEDSAISYQGMRFEDMILRLSIAIPTEVLETITGKFLYGVLYKTRRMVNGVEYPDKEAWEHALIEIPWLPVLPLVQEVLDSNKVFRDEAAKAASIQRVTRVSPTR